MLTAEPSTAIELSSAPFSGSLAETAVEGVVDVTSPLMETFSEIGPNDLVDGIPEGSVWEVTWIIKFTPG